MQPELEFMDDETTRSIRESYDRLAEEYTRRIADELQHKPLDRELLDRFAKETRGRGDVCDMGCGPGHVARYLRDAGASVFGLDLSPGMLEQARKLNPDISFREGNMLSLDIPDGTLAGVTAFYAIVNIPRKSVPLVLSEIRRVLQSSGLLLLAFHTGNEVLHEEELWGQKSRWISCSFSRQRSGSISKRLGSTSRKLSNANRIQTLNTRVEGRISSPERPDSNPSDRNQLKRRITLHQRHECFRRRTRGHWKIPLHFALETV
jgi:ubiquinone/menaquinone biosynthesis C-methylase UbiE